MSLFFLYSVLKTVEHVIPNIAIPTPKCAINALFFNIKLNFKFFIFFNKFINIENKEDIIIQTASNMPTNPHTLDSEMKENLLYLKTQKSHIQHDDLYYLNQLHQR